MSKNVYVGIDRKIVNSVRYYAWKLKSNTCFKRYEIEDIEQELMLFVFSKLTVFKPQKSKIGTFASNVLKNKIKNLIKEKMAQKKEFLHTVFSIDENDIQDIGLIERVFKSVDVNTFIYRNLPSNLQRTCELLKHYNVDEVAEILCKSTSTIYQRIEKVRRLMSDFANYETSSSKSDFLIQNGTSNNTGQKYEKEKKV